MSTSRSWSQQAADDYHLARELIGSVIAAQMARVAETSNEEEIQRLKADVQKHAQRRREISVDDPEAIAAVLSEYPELLRRIRAELGTR